MKKTAFFAHPSDIGLTYTVNRAINFINSSGYDIEVKSWINMNPSGEFILTHVCDEIIDADLFLCDLTQLNLNVLFELGYALVNNKPIWISVDESSQNKDNFEREVGGILSTFAYANYRNSEELGSKFLGYLSTEDLTRTPYKKYIEPITLTNLGEPRIFYLKSRVPTDASNDLTRQLIKSEIPLITDDPQEMSIRPFEWYIESLYRSVGIIAHFLDHEREGKFPQNVKYAFVCGMAYGLVKPIQMLAHPPYKPAIDFKDLMLVHASPEECVSLTDEWLDKQIRPRYESETLKVRARTQKLQASLELQKINLGQYVAEDEELHLADYFVPTAYYDEALRIEKYCLFVGRKGTGKTANLYRIAQELRYSRLANNHVCVIKPTDYDLEGVFELFKLNLAKAEQSYLTESLWKFLIFTELASSVYEVVWDKPKPTWTPAEKEFMSFVDRHWHLVQDDEWKRLL